MVRVNNRFTSSWTKRVQYHYCRMPFDHKEAPNRDWTLYLLPITCQDKANKKNTREHRTSTIGTKDDKHSLVERGSL